MKSQEETRYSDEGRPNAASISMLSSFWPPKQHWPPELQSVLALAYGTEPPSREFCQAQLAASEALGLTARIAARWGKSLPTTDPHLTRLLLKSSLTAERINLVLDGALARVDEVLQELGGEAIVLKGMALRCVGCGLPGSRRMADLDLLMPAGTASVVQAALLSQGFNTPAPTTDGKHLPTLVSPRFGVVELHTSVPGLRRPLLQEETLKPDWETVHRSAQGQKVGLRLRSPSTAFLAAHAIAHSWLVEGHLSGQKIFTLLSDLQDLGALAPRGEWWLDAMNWLPHLSDRDRSAFARILSRWESVEPTQENAWNPNLWPIDERRILDHALAVDSDSDYRQSLRFRSLLQNQTRLSWPKLQRFLWPSHEILRERWPGPDGLLPRAVRRVRWKLHILDSGGRTAAGAFHTHMKRRMARG